MKYLICTLVLLFSGFGCTKKETPSMDHSMMDHSKMDHSTMDHSKMEMPAGKALSGESLYNLESVWTTQDNKKISLKNFKGRPQVVAMIYTSCEHVCPLIVSDMKNIERKLPENLKSKVGFVLITFDPARDTPESFRKYAKVRKIENWTLLTGSSDSILEVAVALGVKYKKLKDGEFSHSNVISILDTEGVLKSQQIGLNQDPTESVENLKGMF